jgi:hypothetical protein
MVHIFLPLRFVLVILLKVSTSDAFRDLKSGLDDANCCQQLIREALKMTEEEEMKFNHSSSAAEYFKRGQGPL